MYIYIYHANQVRYNPRVPESWLAGPQDTRNVLDVLAKPFEACSLCVGFSSTKPRDTNHA